MNLDFLLRYHVFILSLPARARMTTWHQIDVGALRLSSTMLNLDLPVHAMRANAHAELSTYRMFYRDGQL